MNVISEVEVVMSVHPSFERVVELVSWAMSDDCVATFGEVAAIIIREVER